MGESTPFSAGAAPRSLAGWGSRADWCRQSVIEPLLSVLFPPRCVGCGDFEVHVCDSCAGTLADTGRESCRRCGEPGRRPLVGGRCSVCMTKELEYRSARSAFRHEGVARRLVTEFKFGGQPVLGRVMADLARPAFAEYVESIVPAGELFVTWVPTHQSSKRERGYNQAEILARRLASGPPSLPCAELVTKMAGTRHQKGLSKADRQSNLRGAFSADPMRRSKPTLISGSSEGCMSPAILLVDDVFTTGATATAVSSVLTAETGLPVHIFTFSRAVARVVEGHD